MDFAFCLSAPFVIRSRPADAGVLEFGPHAADAGAPVEDNEAPRRQLFLGKPEALWTYSFVAGSHSGMPPQLKEGY